MRTWWMAALAVVSLAGCRCQREQTPAATAPTAANPPTVVAPAAPVPTAATTAMGETPPSSGENLAAPSTPAPLLPDITCPAGTKKEKGESSVRCLRNGQPDGPEVTWNPETGKKLGEVTWKAGKKQGPAKFYYANGQLRLEATYKDDKEDGLHRQYSGGKPISEGEMHAGKPQGKWTWYRPSDGGVDRIECQQDGQVVWVERTKDGGVERKCP